MSSLKGVPAAAVPKVGSHRPQAIIFPDYRKTQKTIWIPDRIRHLVTTASMDDCSTGMEALMNGKQNGGVRTQPTSASIRTTSRRSSLRVALITENESLRDTVSDALKSLAIQPRKFLTPWHFEQSAMANNCDILIVEQQHELNPADPFLAKALKPPQQKRLILLAESPTTRSIVAMMKAGVDSVLDKPVCRDSLRQAIVQVAATERREGRVLCGHLSGAGRNTLHGLTDRQQGVAELIYLGRSNRQIAETLSISVKTVESHRTQIMHRLEVQSVAELIRLMGKRKTT
jgi:FixJ family two-component response regulator